ncbi:MAG: quinolinate synthase NadA [Planctomycetota bacterium]|jgi:quinolinate synthase
MLWQPALPDRYLEMDAEDLAKAIEARRAELGRDLLILGHHYQQDAVIRHADMTGDSLKLARLAAEEAPRRGTKWIVFCGVHFMAETADMLTDDSVAVVLPDLSAGCSMADMADAEDGIEAWDTIHEVLGSEWGGRVIPITYVNSSAAVKAFVGERGGSCCTSTNAAAVFRWALAGGDEPDGADDVKILFLPDQHLGRNTVRKFGVMTEVDEAAGRGRAETAVWNPKEDLGGLTEQTIRDVRVLLWAGHCSVHKLFRPEHVEAVRDAFADQGGVTVLVHPECSQEVVELADLSGSTEYIITQVEQAEPGTNWAIGTEVHLVNRLARQAAERNVHVRMLSDCQCLCTTMYRIDPAHLLWSLDSLASGRIVNRIRVHARTQRLALASLDRMLALVDPPAMTAASSS